MEFSYNKGKITPPLGLRLGGYMHRLGLGSTGVHDDLYVRLLRLSNGDRDFILVQLDLLGLYSNDVYRVRETVRKVLGVRSHEIAVASTHTHSAPETVIPMWPNTLPYASSEKKVYDEWFNNVLKEVKRLSEELINTEKGVTYYVTTSVSDLCYNRSFPGEPYDHTLPILVLKGTNSRVVMYSSPCHPVCNIDLMYSADYHGYVAMNLKTNGIKAIPLTGACGNVDPVNKGYEFAVEMGYRIAESITSALKQAKLLSTNEIRVQSEQVRIPLRTASMEEALGRFKSAYDKYSKSFYSERSKMTPRLEYFSVFEDLLYADQELEVAKLGEKEIDAELQVVSVGEFVFVNIPGELLSDTAMEIKSYALKLTYKDVVFSCYTNGYIGYLPKRRYFDTSKYEAKLALWSRALPEAEEVVVKTIAGALRDIK